MGHKRNYDGSFVLNDNEKTLYICEMQLKQCLDGNLQLHMLMLAKEKGLKSVLYTSTLKSQTKINYTEIKQEKGKNKNDRNHDIYN